TVSKTPVKSREALSLAYTPGVAEPCKVIAQDKDAAYQYTMKANTVAVVSDGSAVLGLGNIGPYAAMPVMEGKAVLFKEFGGVNAVPICLDTQDTEEIIKAVTWLAPAYGGINLEDISAPRCFEIEERLKEILDIPVFHDDQHGTAIVVLAGIINALKVVGKQKENCKVVVNGAGSAGVAITKLLLTYGFTNVVMCDKVGIVSTSTKGLNWMQEKMAKITNPNNETGTLADALRGADIFVGVSAPNIVTPEMVQSMASDSILFAMANPTPEIMPDVAKAAGARVVGTGRSDFPNQVNNVVAFPGIFKGALEGRATQITEEMKLAAANAIAGLVPDDELSEDNIMPEAFNPKVADLVAEAVKSHIIK
ncbi:MAG: NADP-dependent malic enzyme, partial [Lachnospiraceae bacterium]|nr:NADP-dependent malic enzyme [Lachnospiraceae bacterium]